MNEDFRKLSTETNYYKRDNKNPFRDFSQVFSLAQTGFKQDHIWIAGSCTVHKNFKNILAM